MNIKSPTPSEQADNLIRFLAESERPYTKQRLNFSDVGHQIGSSAPDIYAEVVSDVVQRKLITLEPIFSTKFFDVAIGQKGILTVQGWRYYEELDRGKISGNRGFMAMEFKNKILRDILNNHFKPAAKEVGFELATLDDDHIAGLIDARMSVAIRTSAFVVADLTDDNLGAYFEAGFAIGLGKTVIFTCEREKWEEKTHFDTNHHYTVIWDSKEPEKAAEKLKATLRDTFLRQKQNIG